LPSEGNVEGVDYPDYLPLKSAIGTADTVTLDFKPGYRKNSIIAEVKFPALDTDEPKALLNTKR